MPIGKDKSKKKKKGDVAKVWTRPGTTVRVSKKRTRKKVTVVQSVGEPTIEGKKKIIKKRAIKKE